MDRTLEKLDKVVSTDAIILDKCKSWLNLMPEIIKDIPGVWMIDFTNG